MFGLRNRDKTHNNAVYAISGTGRQKYEESLVSGPTYKVLDYLSENGPSSVSEVAQGTGLMARQLERHMRLMDRKGYISEVSGKEEI